jgi:ATP phosphoribosyltransferase regulatory subunit
MTAQATLPRNWLLPEAIEDLLPAQAAHIERLRRTLLDDWSRAGYQLVFPPLLEYLESLLTGSGRDLDLRTFKLVDQTSGRLLGVRADMTPQVARIDAHLLNRQGVTRLCYCGSVLHAMPSDLTASRQPLQIGAELYGHAGIEADIEIVRLLARTLGQCALPDVRIDCGHVAIFRALAAQADLPPALAQQVLWSLQSKDVDGLRTHLACVDPALAAPLIALPNCYGDIATLAYMRDRLPDLPPIRAAFDDLERLGCALPDIPLSVDLSDLRGYHYHSGLMIAAYSSGLSGALALGGRYDAIGAQFGRNRPATGFSLDLRTLVRSLPSSGQPQGILAPYAGDNGSLRAHIAALRDGGETVIEALPGHTGHWAEAGCNRMLVDHDGRWTIEPLQEDTL